MSSTSSSESATGGTSPVHIPEGDRIPKDQKIAYGLGVVADHHAMVTLMMFALPFFQDEIGMKATFVGFIMMITRLWDAFNDPLIGSISDNWKGKNGRRKPFIKWGAILTGCAFPVLWLIPEGWGETGQNTYFVISLLLFYTFYSIFSVPYESLGAELTPNYEERTNVFAVRTYVQQIFNSGIVWYPWLAMALFGDYVMGTRYMSVVIALVIIVAGIQPSRKCVERYNKVAVKQEKVPVIKSLAGVAKNWPALLVMSIMAVYLLAIISGGVMSFYINTYYLYEGDKEAGLKLGAIDGTMRIPFAIFGAVMVQKLANKIDKHKMLLILVVCLLGSWIGTYFLITPSNPYLSLALRPVLAISEAGFWILIISMRADVCDWDEFKFGLRREGVIAAATNWLNKGAMALAVFLGTLILTHVVQYDEAAKVDQLPGVMDRMKMMYVALPITACVLLVGMLLIYPLSREKLSKVRKALEERRDAV